MGHRIRAAALEHHIPYVTSLVTFRATVAAMRALRSGPLASHALYKIQLPSLKV